MTHIAITPYSHLDQDTVLIGANCIPWPKNKLASELRLVVINPYQNHEDIAKAAEFCWNVSIEYCDYLGKLLNEIQGVSYSPRYWKTLLLPWMVAFVENLYDRYLRLCLVRKNFPEAMIEIPKVKLSFPLYKKSDNVWGQAHLQSINTKIYSLLIQLMGLDRNIKYLDSTIEDSENKHKINRIDYLSSLKKPVKKLIKTLYIHRAITWPLPEVPAIKDDGFPEQALNREEIIFKYSDNEFKNVLSNFMQYALPISLFEGYKARQSLVKSFLLKNKTQTVHISAEIWGNDTLKCLAAEVRENGDRIVGRQHGGGYGHYVIATPERVEREISDVFISWGWTDKRNCPAAALPDPRLSKLANTHRREKKDILFIGTAGPMYMFRYQSYWMPEFAYQKYYPIKQIFFRKLKLPIQKHIVYRAYMHEYGWQERERIKEMLPDVCFIETARLLQSIKECSLVVIDHPSTSFLESLVINAPTILFWDNEQCPMREEAQPFFQLLIDAGILYYSPEEASTKINAIWDDVQGWWRQPEVQKAKDEFCWQFARTSKNWRKEWVEFLKGLRDKD